MCFLPASIPAKWKPSIDLGTERARWIDGQREISRLIEAKDDFQEATSYHLRTSKSSLFRCDYAPAYEHAMVAAENALKQVLVSAGKFSARLDGHHDQEGLWNRIKVLRLIRLEDQKTIDGIFRDLSRINLTHENGSPHIDSPSFGYPRLRYVDTGNI